MVTPSALGELVPSVLGPLLSPCSVPRPCPTMLLLKICSVPGTGQALPSCSLASPMCGDSASWTGHLLPCRLSQPLMLRCHLHSCICIFFCRLDPPPSGEQVVTMVLCHHLNLSCPTMCNGATLTLSSSPSPWGTGYPPLGQVLHVLTCPPISSCLTTPNHCPWTRCVAAGRAWGQRTGAWTLGAGKEVEHLGHIMFGFCSREARQETSLSANTMHKEVVRCLLP